MDRRTRSVFGDTLSQCFISGRRVYIVLSLDCIHSSHTTALSSPSKLCLTPKTSMNSNVEFLVATLRSRFLLRLLRLSSLLDLASTFALFKDYFDKKLTALKRDIQEDSLSNSDSIAKKLKEESKISFKFEGTKSSSTSILALRRRFNRLPPLSR